jgi:membrane protein required for colicin V production
MQIIDIILLLPLAWGAYTGYQRGIIIEIISVLAFVISVVTGFRFLGYAISWVSPFLTNQITQRLLPYFGFSIVFFPIVFLIVRLGWLLRRTIRYTVFGSVDSFLGMAVGLFTWAFGVSVLFWLVESIGVKMPIKNVQNAYVYKIVRPIAPTIIGKATQEWIPSGAAKLRRLKDSR